MKLLFIYWKKSIFILYTNPPSSVSNITGGYTLQELVEYVEDVLLLIYNTYIHGFINNIMEMINSSFTHIDLGQGFMDFLHTLLTALGQSAAEFIPIDQYTQIIQAIGDLLLRMCSAYDSFNNTIYTDAMNSNHSEILQVESDFLHYGTRLADIYRHLVELYNLEEVILTWFNH